MEPTDESPPQPPPRNKSADAKKDNEPEKKPPTTISGGFIGLCKIAAKHFPLIMGIYLMGYFRMSLAWMVGLVGLTAAREQWKKERDFRMSAARASSLYDEKDVILARVSDLPSWVFFPDFDRAEWLNKILKQVWPNVGHYVRNIIVESVEPGIRESLASYKLGGFKLDKISLGTIPFRVGGIKVYDKNVARNEIVMDVEIFYAGDCDIRFGLKGLKGGVKDFQLSGMLRVVMKPLISQIPLVGGLQLFFLNSPSVDFNLIGVADVLDMPGLSDILRRVIIDQIGAFLVLPNKLCITLSDTVTPDVLKIPEPAGVLRIRVIEAKKLMKMDVGILGMGKSDPYAIITVGSQEFRTKTINNTINPKWDFYCECVVSESQGQTIHLDLFDKDDGARDDDPLGKATVDIYSVAKTGKKDMWVTLEDVKTGMVHLELTWFGLYSDPNLLKLHVSEAQSLGLSSAMLIVYVDSAKNLLSVKTTSKPDPYVMVVVGNRSEQTSPRMRTSDPVYEQALTFLVCNPESDDLYFKVMDQKTGSEMGVKKITLVSLLTLPNMELPLQPYNLKNSGPESKLLVSVRLKVMVPGQPLADGEEPHAEEVKAEAAPSLPTPSLPATATTASIPPPVPTREKSKTPPPPPPRVEPMEETTVTAKSADATATSAAAKLTKSPTEISITSAAGATTKCEGIPSLDEAVSSIVNPIMSTAKMNLERTPSVRRRVKGGLPPGVISQVQLTLRYSSQRQRLVVVIHKANHLPGGDLPDLPDPYVKLYLLPDRSSNSKRKTDVVRDSINPVFDETVEYTVAPSDLPSRELEVSIINRKGLFARSPLMGQTKISLGQFDLSQALTQWFDLTPSE